MPPTTHYITTPDGFRIAYDVQGSGPALVLLHGLSGDRQRWHAYGVVDGLKDTFTVITLDLRGSGESSTSTNASDYSADAHVVDVCAVADAAGVGRFAVWGWSLGAALATHLAANEPRTTQAIVAGSYLGPIFTTPWLQQQLQAWEPVAALKAAGRLDEISEMARPFAERTDFDVFFARLYGLVGWPPLDATELQAPTTFYTGTNDGRVFTAVEAQRESIIAAGHQVYVMSNFNHVQLIMETDIVLPTVRAFLGL
jgi:pimeloyl-ACP methyl ester carboxylesterase